jgi:hypothetical protein
MGDKKILIIVSQFLSVYQVLWQGSGETKTFFNSAVTIYIYGLRIYEPGLFSSLISVAAIFYVCKMDSKPMKILIYFYFCFLR